MPSTGVDRMSVGERVGVDLPGILLVSLLLFYLPITGVKKCPYGSEPPVAETGHPGLYPSLMPTT